MIHGHGGNVFALAETLGCRPAEITDMSSNINPLGTMPGLIEHLREQVEGIRILPEVDGRAATRAIAALLGVPPEEVLGGVGTTQFIYTACAALASRRVLIVGPTYADYQDGCRMHGIEPHFFLTGPESGFAVDCARLAEALNHCDTVFLCNPNNPTGSLIAHQSLLDLCRSHGRVRFVIDESYLPFAPDGEGRSMAGCGLDNVIVLWSVSKIFAIPGLRAGFLVAREPVVERFRRSQQPWCLNSLAQAAVVYLGAHQPAVESFIQQSRDFLAAEGPLFRQRLAEGPLRCYDSATSYFLISLPEACPADALWGQLAEKRLLIRNCANFHGLDSRYIRIALKDPQANARAARLLLTAVQDRVRS